MLYPLERVVLHVVHYTITPITPYTLTPPCGWYVVCGVCGVVMYCISALRSISHPITSSHIISCPDTWIS